MGKLAALVTETRDRGFQVVAGSASYLLAATLVGIITNFFKFFEFVFEYFFDVPNALKIFLFYRIFILKN